MVYLFYWYWMIRVEILFRVNWRALGLSFHSYTLLIAHINYRCALDKSRLSSHQIKYLKFTEVTKEESV